MSKIDVPSSTEWLEISKADGAIQGLADKAHYATRSAVTVETWELLRDPVDTEVRRVEIPLYWCGTDDATIMWEET